MRIRVFVTALALSVCAFSPMASAASFLPLHTSDASMTASLAGLAAAPLVTYDHMLPKGYQPVGVDDDILVEDGELLFFEPASAVPESAGWALMLASFGLAGAGMRRRRWSVVTA
jgi:hypothetical protein